MKTLDNEELKLILETLSYRPAVSTFIEEYVIDELETAKLFDVFENTLTEEGCRLLHSLTAT